MRKSNSGIPLLLFLTLGLICVSDAAGADDAPSREKCTCDIGSHVGSTVVNAAACLRDRIGDWCDIYLAATENSQGMNVVIARLTAGVQEKDGRATFDLLLDLFNRYIEAQKQVSVASFERLAASYPTLKETLAKAMPQIQECIAKFLNGEKIAAEGEGHSCSVGAESGWLRITLNIGDSQFSYLFAPKR